MKGDGEGINNKVMKFNELVYLAEMDYSKIPGDVGQNVRDASLGEPPMTDNNPVATQPKPERDWDYESEVESPDGKLYIVHIDAEWRDESVDHIPDPRGPGRDVYASVPYKIFDYEVVEVDEQGNESDVPEDVAKRILQGEWEKFSSDSDYFREAGE